MILNIETRNKRAYTHTHTRLYANGDEWQLVVDREIYSLVLVCNGLNLARDFTVATTRQTIT